MEPLENIALEDKVSEKKDQEKGILYKDHKDTYEGLVLLEETKYQSGTSIKYWM